MPDHQHQAPSSKPQAAPGVNRPMLQCVTVLLLAVSALGAMMAIQSIQRINWLRSLLKSDPAFSASAVDEAFNDPASSKLMLNLYLYLGVSVTQLLASLVGFVAVTKSMVGLYKAFFGMTGLMAIARIALLFLMSAPWHVVLALAVHVLALYPLYVYLSPVQEAAVKARARAPQEAV